MAATLRAFSNACLTNIGQIEHLFSDMNTDNWKYVWTHARRLSSKSLHAATVALLELLPEPMNSHG